MAHFSDQWKLIILVPQLGFTVVVSVALSAYLGHWLDSQFQSQPIALALGLAIGFVNGVVIGWKLINRALPREKNGNSKKGSEK